MSKYVLIVYILTTMNDQNRSADELERLARDQFSEPGLTSAEILSIRSSAVGDWALCGEQSAEKPPNYDPEQSGEWESGRNIRAELIRWLCAASRVKQLIDPRGIRIFGGKIQGSLDLSYLTVSFPLKLRKCRLTDDANLRELKIAQLDLGGTWTAGISADGIDVDGDVFFRNGFHSVGEVRLLGAQIRGDLDCASGMFSNLANDTNKEGGDALSLDRAFIRGDLCMRREFVAHGCVRVINVEIGGNFECLGGVFLNAPIEGVPGTGNAILASRSVVRGSMRLAQSFRAEGNISVIGARIEGNLECIDATIRGTLTGEDLSVGGAIFWKNMTNVHETTLNLTDADADTLVDDKKSWPTAGNLRIDGFVYRRLSGRTPTDSKSRIEWLSRQGSFVPQPFRQVAKVLHDEGDYTGALSVLYAMERNRRKQSDKGALDRCWSGVLRWTIGYGYYPGICLVWLLLLVALGWPLFRYGYFAGSIAPLDKDAYLIFDRDKRPPPYYERFNALIYSLEDSFPIVKLGQVDHWGPRPTPSRPDTAQAGAVRRALQVFISPGFLRALHWSQIMLGWFFATMGAAGVSGLLRKE